MYMNKTYKLHNSFSALLSHMVPKNLANNDPGNVLLPDGTKPLPEPVSINQSFVMCRVSLYRILCEASLL